MVHGGGGPARLGDVARALGALAPQGADLSAILGALGYTLMRAPDVPPVIGETPRDNDRSEGEAERDVAIAEETDEVDDREQPVYFEPLEPAGSQLGWGDLPDAEPLARAPKVVAPDPPPEPLLSPRWQRAILLGALATTAPGNEVDVRALVRRLSRGLPIRALPRRVRRSLRRGSQVLLDTSESMAPFAADQRALVEALRRLIDPVRIEVMRFDEVPERVVVEDTFERRAYVRRRGVSVLVVSDLGLGPRPTGEPVHPSGVWHRFFAPIARTSSPAVALVPGRGLERVDIPCVALVAWDERTSPAAVERARKGSS